VAGWVVGSDDGPPARHGMLAVTRVCPAVLTLPVGPGDPAALAVGVGVALAEMVGAAVAVRVGVGVLLGGRRLAGAVAGVGGQLGP
jgi:hypothetical protein